MATVSGISRLRSRLADWRDNWKIGSLTFPGHPLARIWSGFAGSQSDDEDLERIIETMVIPRLLANLDDGSTAVLHAPSSPSAHPSFSNADIAEFSALAMQDRPDAMIDFIDRRLASGCSVEMIYVNLLAPAVRKLAEGWDEDSLDCVDMTMGLWRIEQILGELHVRVPPAGTKPGFAEVALFSPMPGGANNFVTWIDNLGTRIVADCLERAGWQVDILVGPDQHELNVKCAEQFFDLVALTISMDCSSSALRGLVTTIRAISRNPDVRILLGGRFIKENPEMVKLSGADATAADAVSAIALTKRLVKASSCTENRL